jgi:hypothetical protein
MVAQGWNIDYLAGLATNHREYSCFGSGKAAGASETGLAHCWVLRERAAVRRPPALPPPALVAGGLAKGDHPASNELDLPYTAGPRHATNHRDRDHPYFENCTVDASIKYLWTS